ncbi:MAG: hypothetical protein AAGG48_25915 [Planctomycetota bacterium]
MATIVNPEDTPKTTNRSDEAKPARPKPKRPVKKKSAAGKLWRQSMMMIRRVHLYSGIFMFPFVLLYGFSGWFFNHPGYFREGESTVFSTQEVVDGQLSNLPSAAQIAATVVEQMNVESAELDGPKITLTDAKTPRFSSVFSYSVSTDDANHLVMINPVDGSGEVKTVPAEDEDEAEAEPLPNPLDDIRSAPIASNPFRDTRELVPDLLTDLGLPTGETQTSRRSPSVIFSVNADDVPCLVSYSLGSDSISSVREDSRIELDLKDQLRRMHLARTYTPQYDVRWIWAIVVDAMFLSMVFWGVSGLFMWWQVKRTRMLGGGVLVASIVFSGVMFFAMHDNLTERGPRRSTPPSRPTQTKPTESKPTDAKPSQPQPAASQPAASQPAESQPAESRSATNPR